MVSVFVVLTVIATASAASVSQRDEASCSAGIDNILSTCSLSCSAAIDNTLLSTDPGMFCLHTDMLAEIMNTATTHERVEPVFRVDDWLELMCDTGFCRSSNQPQTLETIVSTIEAGCCDGT